MPSVKQHILYVDDEIINLNSFRMVMGGKYKIHLTEKPGEVLDILRQQPIKVLISDQKMPEMSGLELIAKVKKEFPRIVCVILTAFSESDIMLQAINQGGVYRFMLKPWDNNEMLQTIENAIDKYSLEAKNKVLIDELTKKNAELETYNEELLSTTQALRETQEQLETHNEKLEAAKLKAEESDKLKTAFIQNISHEIRTPMNGIMGFANLLKGEDLERGVFDRYLGIILDSCDRLLEIVDSLMDISRIESGFVEIHEEACNLNIIMASLYEKYERQAKMKSLIFNFNSQLKSEEAFVYADENKLKQILDNLINNAIKFTNSGHVTYVCEIKNNNLLFMVNDSGIGISSDMHKMIFERFRQIELTMSRRYEGTGLGLSIAKGYISLMGGRIWVESNLNEGSSFYFTIPYKPYYTTEKKYSFTLKEKDLGLSDSVVLIVEDDETNYQYLKELLEKQNITTMHAKTGVEAIMLIEMHNNIDLVLMDIRMPELNGFDATEKIKTIRPDLPVVAQTAFAGNDEIIKAQELGFDGYLTKPVKKEALFEKISKFLNPSS